MTPQTVIDVLRQTLLMAFWLGLPLLAVGFVVGIAVSLVQIVTSLQDPAFSTVPRLAAFAGAAVLLLPWMLAKMTGYMTSVLGDLGRYAH